MQNYPCCNAVKGFSMGNKIFVGKFKCNRFVAVNIFPYFRNAEATFVITPFIAIQRLNMCINKNTFVPYCQTVNGEIRIRKSSSKLSEKEKK